ncbi:MAG: histidine--tRNA ligase [Melioribacteraceae bacterium]
MKYKTPRGTQDFLPDYLEKWKYVEAIWREMVDIYGYREIETPMFEETDLFTRTAGESSDIVSKEMYTFIDKGGRSLTLRPEGTAPVVRSYFEHNMKTLPQPVKLFYLMPMFRYERPQAGRFRQHYQYGVECIGVRDPMIDVQTMLLFVNFYKRLGLIEPKIHLNSLGDDLCRNIYKEKLIKYFHTVKEYLCEQCNYRIIKNPLRVLDCKEPSCREYIDKSPLMIDNLCNGCKEDFQQVKNLLNNYNVPYVIEPMLVRGLDYYSRTVFEVTAKGITRDEAIAGGGRYDSIFTEIGNSDISAVGAGAGMERLIGTLEKQNISFNFEKRISVFIAVLGGDAKKLGFKLMNHLREKMIKCEMEYRDVRIKAQMKKALDLGVNYLIIIGENEISEELIVLKNLKTFTQIEIPFYEVEKHLK